jgi:uncharacterized protein (DUF2267 family)
MNDDESPEGNKHLQAAMLQALEDQLESSETPEVKAELDRLVKADVDEEDAKEMMAGVLLDHIVRLTQGSQSFDYQAYLADLRKLG